MEKKCVVCSKIFTPNTNNNGRRKQDFCSLECYWMSMKLPRLSKECLHCKKTFIQNKNVNRKTFNKQKYCSLQCAVKNIDRSHLIGENANHWKGGKPICQNCGGRKEYNRRICKECLIKERNCLKIKKQKEKEFKKINKKKSWNYLHDRSKLKKSDDKMNDSAYKEWVKLVRTRDNNKCRLMDNNCNGRLETHHIIAWRENKELRYSVDNGITLCHKHHPRGSIKEKLMINIFKEIICQMSKRL